MRSLAAFFLFFLLFSCYQRERNCTDFKNGTFEFESFVGTELVKTTFVRNDTLEVDYYEGQADSASVRWINDCEFIVKKLHPKTRNEQKPVHMKIISTSGDTYTFEYSLVGDSKNKKQGTVTKVN